VVSDQGSALKRFWMLMLSLSRDLCRSRSNKTVGIPLFKHIQSEAVSDCQAAPAYGSYGTASTIPGPGAVAPGGVGIVEFPETGVEDIADG
jgi:hypothetical protein